MDDLISRQAAQTELMTKCERYTLARESHGMGRVEWSSDLISVADAMDAIRDLPSAQPERKVGKWIPVMNGRGGHCCNRCNGYAPSYMNGDEHLSDFCPDCGAKMELVLNIM